jgi:cell division septation protein DedD
MNIERIVGLIFSISALLVLLFVVLTPQIDYQQELTITQLPEVEKTIKDEVKIEETQEVTQSPKVIKSKASNIEKSDFDLFVLRVHVLSSKDNANNMVTKIIEGGFPAFTEVFGSQQNLHAVYVGPFIEESDIKLNLDKIEKVSESKNGEISRWKL